MNNNQNIANITNINTPNDIFIEMINLQTQKEDNVDIWKNSPYKHLVKLQA